MTWQRFQREICKMLSEHGFWAYETINKKSGQPVDVIAVKSDIGYIIECKVTKSNRFPLSRVEDNQITAIERFTRCKNKESWFAFYFAKHPDEILFVRAEKIIALLDKNVVGVSYDELKEMSEDFFDTSNANRV